MVSTTTLFIFAFAALCLVLSPGPNMIYLISRSICQGRSAGIISLFGVILGFVFHLLAVSFGITSIFFTAPLAYDVLKYAGAMYLLWLAWNAIKPGSVSVFAPRTLLDDSPSRLFQMGFFTNVLNPKVAVFYLSFFPQFIDPRHGSVLSQSLILGLTQISVSFIVNFIIVITASSIAAWFSKRPAWLRFQRWLMASVLGGLAIHILLSHK